MTTINFSDDFSALEQRVFRQAAHAICRELGASNHDATISIMRCTINAPVKAAVTRTCQDQFLLVLNNTIAPDETVHTIGHELIHFHQYMRGDLVDRRDNGKTRTFWKGREYPDVSLARQTKDIEAYLDQPWEQEAFAKHDDLYEAVVDQIALEDRSALMLEHLGDLFQEIRNCLPSKKGKRNESNESKT